MIILAFALCFLFWFVMFMAATRDVRNRLITALRKVAILENEYLKLRQENDRLKGTL